MYYEEKLLIIGGSVALCIAVIALIIVSPFKMSKRRIEKLRIQYPVVHTAEYQRDIQLKDLVYVPYYAVVTLKEELAPTVENYENEDGERVENNIRHVKMHVDELIIGTDSVIEGAELKLRLGERETDVLYNIKIGSQMVLPISNFGGGEYGIMLIGPGCFYVVDNYVIAASDEAMGESCSGMRLKRFIKKIRALKGY